MDYYNQYFEGIFWVKHQEERKLTSTLYIDKEGNATISSLKPLEKDDDISDNWKTLDLVLGYIHCNTNSKTYSVKLYNVHKTFNSIGPLAKYKYQSYDTIIASTYDSKIASSSFNIIMLNSDPINNWVPITGFDFKGEIDKSFEISHLYKQPEKIQLFKNNDFEIYFFFRASTSIQKRRKSFITENVFINIEASKSLEINEITKIKTSIERLFNLILFIPFQSSIIEVQTTNKVNYRIIKKLNNFDTRLTKSIDFTLFKENSNEIFFNWFEKQNNLELAIINFFSVYGQKGVLIENKFLTYISILENYHKNNIKKEDHLKSRLKHLLQQSILEEKLNNIDKFAQKLKTTRNYHAHLEEKHELSSFKGIEIFKVNNILEFIIREIFLKEIGLYEKIKIPNYTQDDLIDLNV